MSYILQALKESEDRRGEQGRRSEAEPDPQTVATMMVAAPVRHQRRRWLLPLGLVLLAVFALLALKGEMDLSTPTATVSQEVTEARTATLTPGREKVSGHEIDMRGVKLVVNSPREGAVQDRVSEDGASSIASIKREAEHSVSRATIEREPSAAGQSAPEEVATESPPVAPDPYTDLPYLRQMPVGLQRELPDMRFSVHIYSPSPESRMVKLGDRVLREGQRLTSEVTIEAIIPRGAVLRYREHRFKVPAL